MSSTASLLRYAIGLVLQTRYLAHGCVVGRAELALGRSSGLVGRIALERPSTRP
jgi:hypothetical protein